MSYEHHIAALMHHSDSNTSLSASKYVWVEMGGLCTKKSRCPAGALRTDFYNESERSSSTEKKNGVIHLWVRPLKEAS